MDIREQIRILEMTERSELDRVPAWARAEHMEQCVPLEELWKYPEARKEEPGLPDRVIQRITSLMNRLKRAGKKKEYKQFRQRESHA